MTWLELLKYCVILYSSCSNKVSQSKKSFVSMLTHYFLLFIFWVSVNLLLRRLLFTSRYMIFFLNFGYNIKTTRIHNDLLDDLFILVSSITLISCLLSLKYYTYAKFYVLNTRQNWLSYFDVTWITASVRSKYYESYLYIYT